jgi:hypothetical protein
MKRLLITLTIVAFLASVTVAAPTIQVNSGPYGTTGGGLFEITVTDGSIGPYGLNDVFYSMCIETDEFISLGSEYDVVLNTAAVMGGSGGPEPDPLDYRSAYLFQTYVCGGLVTSDAVANDVQNAIWYIEGEGGANNALVTEATDAGWTDLGNVRVMNLYDASGALCQDLLVCIPAPGAILLSSIGIAFVGYLRERRMV